MTESQGERGYPGETGETGEAGATGETGVAGATGVAGRRGESGLTGLTGEAGVAGRQGEAGVAGRQGEAGTQGEVGTQGETGQPGVAGKPGRRGVSFSNTQVTAVFLFVVLAFAVLSVRTEIQQRHINRNSEQIIRNQHDNALLQYTICTDRNRANVALIKRIDVEIAAEKRKPHPDLKRISGLNVLKPAVPNCGPKP